MVVNILLRQVPLIGAGGVFAVGLAASAHRPVKVLILLGAIVHEV